MNSSLFRRHRHLILNITSSSGLLILGDFCAQVFYDKKQSLDYKRLFAACITGSIWGIQGHIWYAFLDRKIAQPIWKNVFKKVVLDQSIAAPMYTATYIISTSALEGRISAKELKGDIKENFLPLYLADCVVFIPVQIINFRYIPAYYRVPFMCFIAFFYNTFLSAYKHTHEGHEN